MKLFFIALAFSLVLAGLACAQDSPSSSPVLLAADDTGSGPGGPPPGAGDGQNATRPQGQGGPDGPGGKGGPGGGGRMDADNSTRPQGAGQPPAWGKQQDGSGRPGKGGPGGPPPGFSGGQGGRGGSGGPGGPGGGGQGRQQNHEALAAACSGKSAGDACSFTGPQGDAISGQCVQARQGNDLVCRPGR